MLPSPAAATSGGRVTARRPAERRPFRCPKKRRHFSWLMNKVESSIVHARPCSQGLWPIARRSASLLAALGFLASCSASDPERDSNSSPDEPARSTTSPPATVSTSAIQYAWWVTAEFSPSNTEIFGIPVFGLNRQWDRASLLSRALLPAAARADPSLLDDPDYGFEIEGDFDRDGSVDRAGVGVFRDTAGREGSFLVIVKSDGAAWHLDTLFSATPGARFSILSLDADSVLRWRFCMECGDFLNVVHGPGGYRLESP